MCAGKLKMLKNLKRVIRRLSGSLSKDSKINYLPEVLEAAERDECNPEDVFYCDLCRMWHESPY